MWVTCLKKILDFITFYDTMYEQMVIYYIGKKETCL